MSVVLYKAGNTHKVNGIKCEVKSFDEYSYLHNLDAGWFYSPEECYAEEKEEQTEEQTEEETETEEDGVLNLNDLEDKQIRSLAKEKGITGWYNKGIERLKTEIGEWQQEN